MGEALALLALVLFSTNVLLVKVASARVGQDLGFLFALGTNVLFSGALFLGHGQFRTTPFIVEWDGFAMFAVGGIFTAYLGRRLFFLSVQSLGASRASALQVTNPVFAAVISWLAIGEALGPVAILCVLAAVVGLYLTSQVPHRDDREAGVTMTPLDIVAGTSGHGRVHAWRSSNNTSLPGREIGLALVGALSYAVGNVIRSVAVRDWGEAIFGGFLGAATATLFYLLIHTDLSTLLNRIHGADRAGLALWGMSGVLTISAQISLIASTQYIPVAVGVVIATAIPVLVIPASVALFHNNEAVTGRTVAGSLLILNGVAGLLLS